MSRRAFTIVELMVGLIIAGVVSLLAYGTLRAGLDSEDRIASYRSETESVALLRSVLTDALRHIASAPNGETPPVEIENTITADGVNAGILRVVSRGVTDPLGTGRLWRISLEGTRDGLRYQAVPLEDTLASGISSLLPHIRGVRVRALSDDDLQWQMKWGVERRVPRAIEITFEAAAQTSAHPVLLVFTGLDGS